MRRWILLLVTLPGCVSAVDNACDHSGTYTPTYEQQITEVDCGLDANTLVTQGDVPPGCELVSDAADSCATVTVSRCGVFTMTSESTWSPDGSEAHGRITITASDGSCSSEYAVTLVRN